MMLFTTTTNNMKIDAQKTKELSMSFLNKRDSPVQHLTNTAVKRLRMCERWSGEKATKMAERPRGFKLRHSNRLTGVKNDHTSE